MADEMDGLERGDVLAFLLSKDGNQPQDEPLIAANIHEQLQHMGLSSWSISVLRRLRDAVGRLAPARVLEVGASIGHRTAWLLDEFERKERTPTALTLVEQGGKFAVILQRLLQRYEAMSWASVVVGEPEQLAAEHQAWALASATGTELSQTPFESGYDVIVIDGPPRPGEPCGNLPLVAQRQRRPVHVEPDMPTGDVAEDDVEGMAMVNGFNRWIELVGETQSTHHVAFMPLFGGTLVAWLPHA